jgi:hypothetical protein
VVVRGCELRDWVGRPLPTHLLHPYIRCHHLVLFILGHKQEEDSRFVLGDRIHPHPVSLSDPESPYLQPNSSEGSEHLIPGDFLAQGGSLWYLRNRDKGPGTFLEGNW